MESARSFEVLDGFATTEGTEDYRRRAISKAIPESHFRLFEGLHLSSTGIGTYLGDLSEDDSAAMEEAVFNSVMSGGINVIDTAINYRAMLSEKSIGRALLRLASSGVKRNELFVCTKNGYVTNDGQYPGIDIREYIQRMFIDSEVIEPGDISSGSNVMKPSYLARCIDKSLMNMHLSTIDLVYLHNAFESWHADVSTPIFMEMLAKSFELYEKYRQEGKIRFYGMATWTCFRVPADSEESLSLEQVVKTAEEVGGKDHGFRFIQLPYNMTYNEAYFSKNQIIRGQAQSVLDAAKKLRIGVFTSVPLMQGRLLTSEIPDFAGITNNLSKVLQFVRSTPGVLAPLVGQKSPSHVAENLAVTKIPPLDEGKFREAATVLTGN